MGYEKLKNFPLTELPFSDFSKEKFCQFVGDIAFVQNQIVSAGWIPEQRRYELTSKLLELYASRILSSSVGRTAVSQIAPKLFLFVRLLS